MTFYYFNNIILLQKTGPGISTRNPNSRHIPGPARTFFFLSYLASKPIISLLLVINSVILSGDREPWLNRARS